MVERDDRAGWHEQCQRCGTWWPASQLLRQLVEVKLPQGENRFTYSSYNAAGWTCTAADAGEISQSDSRFYIDHSGVEHGAQTWEGDGVLTSAPVDCSGASERIRMSFRIGPYHGASAPELTVVIGAKKGANDYPMRTITVRGAQPTGASLEVSAVDVLDISALELYVDVTTAGGEKWWVDTMRLELDVSEASRRGEVIVTEGAAVVRTADEVTTRALVVCPHCRSKPLQIETAGDPEVDEPREIPEDLEVR